MTAGFAHNLFIAPPVGMARDAAAAIILLDDGRYLMQLRDDKAGIFYPGHWGLFGGALEDGEDAETALRRELVEELDWQAGEVTHFTTMDFGFDALGGGKALRLYYEVRMSTESIPKLRLGEGQRVDALDAADILLDKRVVPYDSFAVWMHCVSRAQAQQRKN